MLKLKTEIHSKCQFTTSSDNFFILVVIFYSSFYCFFEFFVTIKKKYMPFSTSAIIKLIKLNTEKKCVLNKGAYLSERILKRGHTVTDRNVFFTIPFFLN